MSERKIRPLIVPIFIPNQGCPHRCIFCDQQRITSEPSREVQPVQVKQILDKAISSEGFDPRRGPEVAFYGGTFTGLPYGKIKGLLEAVTPYLRDGLFRSIRVSTRPDSLDERSLKVMKDHGVLTVELGVQSMEDRILALSQRGYSSETAVKAVEVLRKYGFGVGVQLMPGLPGDSFDTFLSTIVKTLSLRPDMVRLYPALVIRGTELARWYSLGRYKPLTLGEAVEICKVACLRLEAQGIPVIRIGLMSSPSLAAAGEIIAGPWHPAFGFLVRSAAHLSGIEDDLPNPGDISRIMVWAPKQEISLIRGYKNQGLRWIEAKTGARVVGIEPDDSVAPGRLRIQEA